MTDEQVRLELINTLRRGHCLHHNRVNICSTCCEYLEKLVKQTEEPKHG